ncbi:Hypothetical protein BP5553_04030 [Venustampulla echinocandica]|uniref:Myb-like domain-containing protein n=1 Tax=Venustampulla echinocandica TaxID=2656787 RepID=A0A370TVZ2_9HELO|nr:Hypothetical protein BP5553_04030 [Venustampulla echinocandica]RDL39690.1 Hypothetical protein BP5553_04030 [Venustampulla echinocandica]
MSGYRPGHDANANPYIEYASQSDHHPEERVFGSHPGDIQHGTSQGITTPHGHYGAHQHQQQPPHPQHQVYPGPLAPDMAHHQSPQYGGGQPHLLYGTPRQMQPATGTKRQRDEDDLEMGLPIPPHMGGPGEMSMPSHMQQPMVDYGSSSMQPQQTYHNHGLPPSIHPSKRSRSDDPSSSMLSPPSGGAPSVVGHPGMPDPAPRPRGPKLKFTPEDDQKLVDLKENKNLTWKQIAEFFPGRSSGTLQVRYCTKLKAKTTQWTDETIQKLRTALHDYEQEKWRIVAQKVGTGFTSTACKEKAMEIL